MYVSHKFKFIFLRSPKTASSSLSEFFINNIPDDNAIYTPVEDSKIKGTLDPLIIRKYKTNFKYYHFTIEDLIKEKIITEHHARTYRVISVLRDPIDRQKSFFYFYSKWKAKGRPLTLDLYKSLTPQVWFQGEPNSSMLQADFCKLNGEYIGEYWLYENLENHLNQFMKDIKVESLYPLAKHKSGFRKNRGNEIQFDEESISKLKKVFAKDFELYNELKGK